MAAERRSCVLRDVSDPLRNACKSQTKCMSPAANGAAVPALPPLALAALLLAVFAVWFGYSVVLPVLPTFIQAADPGLAAKAVARHTGLASALYTLALFLFAPLWGRLSDRHGRRPVISIGLLGYAVSLLGVASLGGLAGLYIERLTSGLFAAAISPVASAVIGDCAPNEEWRARRLAWLGMAATAGLFLGPAAGAVAAAHSGASLAFAATAALAIITWIGALAVLPLHLAPTGLRPVAQNAAGRRAIPFLLVLSLVVGIAVGVFEVGLALRGAGMPGMGSRRLALLFAECSLVMFIAQAVIFSPVFKAAATWRMIAPSLAIMGAGVLLLPWSNGLFPLAVVVGLVGVSGGILVPVLTFWISLAAGSRQGASLGSQVAAASLGQGIGSAAVGLLLDSDWIPDTPFVLAAALLGLSAAMSLSRAGRFRNLKPMGG